MIAPGIPIQEGEPSSPLNQLPILAEAIDNIELVLPTGVEVRFELAEVVDGVKKPHSLKFSLNGTTCRLIQATKALYGEAVHWTDSKLFTSNPAWIVVQERENKDHGVHEAAVVLDQQTAAILHDQVSNPVVKGILGQINEDPYFPGLTVISMAKQLPLREVRDKFEPTFKSRPKAKVAGTRESVCADSPLLKSGDQLTSTN